MALAQSLLGPVAPAEGEQNDCQLPFPIRSSPGSAQGLLVWPSGSASIPNAPQATRRGSADPPQLWTPQAEKLPGAQEGAAVGQSQLTEMPGGHAQNSEVTIGLSNLQTLGHSA